MASCSRALAIKATLGAGFLLILLNLLASRWDSTPIGLPRMGTTQWPKRTRTSHEMANHVANLNNNNSNTTTQQRNNDSHTSNHTSASAVAPGDPESSPIATILANGSGLISPNESQPAGDLSGSNSSYSPHNSSAPAAPGGSVMAAVAESSKNSIRPLSSNSEHLIAANSSNSTNTSSSNSSSNSYTSNNNKTKSDSPLHPESSRSGGLIARLVQQESCPPIPPNLDGPYEVDMAYESLTSVEQKLAPKLQPGGQYSPRECAAHDRVAIIVPYRDREQHLPVFLKNMHPFLQKQQIEYGIYIVEQTSGSQFNRASLMNIGFAEAMKQKSWDCMVFHDVDLLPMDDRNLYTCPDQPRHMSVAVDTFGFKLPYNTIFGGVSAMTTKQFRTVNGFSNSFWGWGGEDDDMSNRLKHVGFHIARYPINIARYTMLSHKKEKANPKRYEKLVTGAKRYDSDGLNSLHYQLVNLIRKPLYTWVHVEISPDSS
ncbi:beta-1,4-N-acetylgalactosaminyltransferase bre-4-like [Uranotaenia lowii]|uniref:beta-1,4-N-acetylgalactosaminyltransferase bre-4-like n=1 Tax=Uranotaenia lowii TaxID=190385 RepID=UPI002479AA49|nr:beta-1,4-N-acetylgalactosaminyltransferase bre-4-like [Uranotaenia lowii]